MQFRTAVRIVLLSLFLSLPFRLYVLVERHNGGCIERSGRRRRGLLQWPTSTEEWTGRVGGQLSDIGLCCFLTSPSQSRISAHLVSSPLPSCPHTPSLRVLLLSGSCLLCAVSSLLALVLHVPAPRRSLLAPTYRPSRSSPGASSQQRKLGECSAAGRTAQL